MNDVEEEIWMEVEFLNPKPTNAVTLQTQGWSAASGEGAFLCSCGARFCWPNDPKNCCLPNRRHLNFCPACGEPIGACRYLKSMNPASESGALMAQHKHPNSEKVVEGIRLEKGAVMLSTDLYASPNGEWVPIHRSYVGRSLTPGPLVVRPKTVS